MTADLMVIGIRGLVAGAAVVLLMMALYSASFSKYYAEHKRRVNLPCKPIIMALRRIVIYMTFALAYLVIFYTARLVYALPRDPLMPAWVKWMEWASYPVLFVALLLPVMSLFAVIRRADEIRDNRLDQVEEESRRLRKDIASG